MFCSYKRYRCCIYCYLHTTLNVSLVWSDVNLPGRWGSPLLSMVLVTTARYQATPKLVVESNPSFMSGDQTGHSRDGHP